MGEQDVISEKSIKWLLFLKDADKSSWEALKMNESILKKAMDTLEFLSQDREARRLYEERQKYLHDEVLKSNRSNRFINSNFHQLTAM